MDTSTGPAQNETPSIFVSPEAAAELLRVSRSEVFALLRTGELASVRHRKRRLVSRRSIEEWADRQLAAAGFAEAS